jgi:excisionase family DNA binding protein
MTEHTLYTVQEIAARLKVTPQFIYNLSSVKLPPAQRLPSIRVGRLRRFRFEEVIQYFEDRARG